MNFEEALHDLKNGFRLTRNAWATALYVVLQPGYPEGIAINRNTATATGLPEGTVCVFRPYFMIRNADNSFSPWVPSVGDVLAEDWHVVPDQVGQLSVPHGEALAGPELTEAELARMAEVRGYYTPPFSPASRDTVATVAAAVTYMMAHPELPVGVALTFERQPDGGWVVTGHEPQPAR